MKSWVNFIHKKTPFNHSAVSIWNLDLASTRSSVQEERSKMGGSNNLMNGRQIIVGMALMTIRIALRVVSSFPSWVEKPARTAAAVDTNALQIVALTEKLISTSFRESVLSVLQHLKFD